MFKVNVNIGEISCNVFDERDYSTSRPQNGVFDGFFRKKIKVKVRLVEDEKVTESEVENFVNLNSHPNVQRLFGHEFEDSIHYFALQDFDVNLREFMEFPRTKNKEIDLISIIKDITEGLEFLHDNKIVHGNICISNVGIEYKTKRAMLCNCGLDDLQEDIFVTPEELADEEPSFEADIFNLGVVIFYILSNGRHPFGSIHNKATTIKNIKDMTIFKCSFKDFDKTIPIKFKAECAISMLKKILRKNPNDRIRYDKILDEPFFWNNYEIYEFFQRVDSLWNVDASDEDRKMTNEKGLKYFRGFSFSYRIEDEGRIVIKEDKCVTNLVNLIASKVKHYEDEYYTEALHDEHIFNYLNFYDFVLPFVYEIDNEVTEQQSTKRVDQLGNAISLPEKESLWDILLKANLPQELIIPLEKIDVGVKINESNAKVYCGKFNGLTDAIKKVEKEKFKIREIESHYKLSQRKSSKNPKCRSCKMDECENIIKFYGCYEEDNYICLVCEKAERDLSHVIYSKNKDDEKVKQYIFDAAKGLKCLHANNISHLDIKPQNILVVNRNGKFVGCLADFGECIEAIKKTYTKTKLRATDGYVAPELITINRNRSRIQAGRKWIEPSINFAKCDIFSLGIVVMKDFLRVNTIDVNRSATHSLSRLRNQGKISFECEELAIFMTKYSPTDRPDAEGVTKNPFFWSIEKKFEFLRAVDAYGRRHQTDQKRKSMINKEAVKKLFVKQSANRHCWADFYKKEPEIQDEIKKYLQIKNKDSKSIFDLVELILYLLTPESSDSFKHTKEILQISNTELDSMNLENYLNYWFKKFELIGFLYYTMQDDLKILYREYYSMDCPKRMLNSRKMTIDEESKAKASQKFIRFRSHSSVEP